MEIASFQVRLVPSLSPTRSIAFFDSCQTGSRFLGNPSYVAVRPRGSPTSASIICHVGKAEREEPKWKQEGEEAEGLGPVCLIPECVAMEMKDEMKDFDWVEIEMTSPVVLEEVVLVAAGDREFLQAKDPSGELHSYISDPNRPPLLIRQGSPLTIGSLSFNILMSQPLLQGIISLQTKLVISQQSPAEKDKGKGMRRSSETLRKEGTNLLDLLYPSILPRVYFAQTEAPEGLHFPLPQLLKKSGPSLSETLASSLLFQLKQLQAPVSQNALIPGQFHREDPHVQIFTSFANLAALGISSGTWVVIVSEDSSHRTRVCKLYGQEAHEPSTVFGSPLLFFNLGHSSSTKSPFLSIRILGAAGALAQGQLLTGLESGLIYSPPVAKSVTISRVKCPNSDGHSTYTKQLREYFSVPRIMAQGDLFPLEIEAPSLLVSSASQHEEEEEEEEEIDEDAPKGPRVSSGVLIYFKVEQILGEEEQDQTLPSMTVDIRQTSLTKAGSCHSRVPSTLLHNFVMGSEQTLLRNGLGSPPGMGEKFQLLEKLLGASFHPVFSLLNIGSTILIQGLRGIGKRTLVQTVTQSLGLHLYEKGAIDIVGDSEKKTEANLKAHFEMAQEASPCVFLLRNIEDLSNKSDDQDPNTKTGVSGVIKEALAEISRLRGGNPDKVVVLIATTDKVDDVPTAVQSLFAHQVLLESPDEKSRLEMLHVLTSRVALGSDVNVKTLATKTAAMLPVDLGQIISDAVTRSLRRISSSKALANNISMRDVELAGVEVIARDFEQALDMAHAVQADSIGAAKIPNVTWQDIGGLASVKDDILDTIQLPLERPELFSSGLRQRSGILLYGPPGTGKTLLAKAVATECSLNFLSVKGPELINMYVGESEKNVRDVFQKARNAKPCVVFFDELDSLAPNRGNAGDSGGVMDRIVSQLLAELDGVSNGGDVFVIGATNRPDLIDPALLRPGRFDKLIYLSISEDHDSQLKIIQALTRKFRLDPKMDLRRVVEKLKFTYTGADFYAMCTDAMMNAMKRKIGLIEEKVDALKQDDPKFTVQKYLLHQQDQEAEGHVFTDASEGLSVEVNEEDFEQAISALIPSVSEAELAHYKKVQMQFNDSQDSESSKKKKPGKK